MSIIEQHIEAARKVYELFWESYLSGDMDTFASVLDEQLELIGTSESEIAHSKSEGLVLLEAQMHEVVGNVEKRNRKVTSVVVDDLVLINELCDIYFINEQEWNFYSRLRLSTLLRENGEGWKVFQQHGSLPDHRVEGDETLALEKISKENLELRDAIKRRTAELENKNRELEIEAALERVRTIAMGMKKPDDLLDVCRIISEQLELLNVSNIRNVQVAIIDEPKKIYANYQYFSAYANSVFEETGYDNNPASRAMVEEMQKSANSFFIGSIKEDELQQFREWRKYHNQFPDPILDDLTEVFYYFYSIGQGGLGLTTYRAINEDELGIFKRFHLVFKLAYSRFMDIQQAEIQAQEARLELSLERIRAQVTAMKESSELLDIVVTMRTEFVNLGHEAHYFWYMRWLPEKYEKAMTSGDGTRIGMVMSLPRHIHGDVKLVADWEKSDEPTVVFAMDKETAVGYVHKMITLGDFEQVDPQAPTLDDIRHIGGLTFIMARTTLGEIGFSLPGNVPDPPQDAVETLKRFARVFDLAYKRFEDLKAAERQHREAKIELALERVRARSMAMRKSDELADLSLELVKQVHALGVDTWFCAFNIYDDDPKGSLEWGSNGQGTFPQYRTPREGIFLSYYEAGKSGETLLVNEIAEKECPAHYDYLCSLSGVGEQLLKMKDAGIPFPTSQIDHVAYFKYGYIIFITFEPAREAHDIFKRFARVFEQTYTRFLDLQKAEAQAVRAENDLIAIKAARQKAEKALSELKSTQAQLIQQEKLASLGQLTAGIAHEIKNPLNFVNNFSEVSMELIEEVMEEVKTQGLASQQTITEILTDIQSNLAKIHEHGTRANGIVSSMLLHSRGGSGKMEPADLNALIKEYVNLSFHGMRAGKNPINVDIKLDLDDSFGKIALIEEDFSRVLLNLCNNAFDAMREKTKTDPGYKPLLVISTKQLEKTVEIAITDNGPGIPDNIKDKILQPFFTTKKGTEGTGLGLSITHDIVKAHGGELSVNSKINTYTEFIIQLPV